VWCWVYMWVELGEELFVLPCAMVYLVVFLVWEVVVMVYVGLLV